MSQSLRPPQKRGKRLKIKNFFSGINSLFDQSVISPATAIAGYNFDFSTGALTDGCGIDYYPPLFNNNCVKAWKFSRFDPLTSAVEEIIVFSTSLNSLGYLRDNQVSFLASMEGNIHAVNYRIGGSDCMIFCSDKADMLVWDGVNPPFTVANAPKVRSMAVHYERLFVVTVDGQRLRFSDDLDPTNWNESSFEGGYIELSDEKGKINKIVSFLNYIYVFREYGISRLTAFGDQSDFAVTPVFIAGGKIFPETVAVCGNAIMFLASDGLYKFDGLSAVRVLNNLTGLIDPTESAVGGYCGGRYYLLCRLNRFGDYVGSELSGYINNGIIAFEPDGRYFITRGVDATAFAAADYPLVVSRGEIGKIVNNSKRFGVPLLKRWISPKTDLSSEKPKLMRELYITTNVPIDFSVTADGKTSVFNIAGSEHQQKIRINLRGVKFSFSIDCIAVGANITAPTFVIVEL